jgi:NAD(P)H-hydrate epimerase
MLTLSRDEIRGVDRCAIEILKIPGLILMENAGRNAADAVADFLGGAGGKSVAVVAGGGNNGGDGFVAARHLAMRGANVVTFIVAEAHRITGDAAVNLGAIYHLSHDIRQRDGHGVAELLGELKAFDLVVDAIGGTGITGQLHGDLAATVDVVNGARRPIVAIDIPTGLDCDTGRASDPTIRAAMTVTMLARKKGFDAPGAEKYTGEVRVVDIGIPAELVAEIAGQHS